MYNIEYTIYGIYGRVSYAQSIKPEELETLENDMLHKKENQPSFFISSFDVEVRDCETFKKVAETKSSIKGLPTGLTEDMYFKMSLLKSINELPNKISNINTGSILNTLNSEMYKAGLKIGEYMKSVE